MCRAAPNKEIQTAIFGVFTKRKFIKPLEIPNYMVVTFTKMILKVLKNCILDIICVWPLFIPGGFL